MVLYFRPCWGGCARISGARARMAAAALATWLVSGPFCAQFQPWGHTLCGLQSHPWPQLYDLLRRWDSPLSRWLVGATRADYCGGHFCGHAGRRVGAQALGRQGRAQRQCAAGPGLPPPARQPGCMGCGRAGPGLPAASYCSRLEARERFPGFVCFHMCLHRGMCIFLSDLTGCQYSKPANWFCWGQRKLLALLT